MLLALSRDAVVVLGGEELQQPLPGYLIGVLIRESLESPLGAPAADGAGGIAGDAGNLVGVQHVGLAGQQVLVPAAHTPAGGVGEEERAVQAEGRGLVIRVVLVPAAGRGVVRRLRQAAAQVGGHVGLGDLVAAGLLAGVLAGHQADLQQVDGGAGADAAGLAEVGAAHGVGIGGPAGPGFPAPGRPQRGLLSSSSVLLCFEFGPGESLCFSLKLYKLLNTEKYYIKSAQNLAFGKIRFPAAGRKSSVHLEYQPPIILHEILHFSRKFCQTGPKLGASFTCTHAIFRASAFQKRLDTAEKSGIN